MTHFKAWYLHEGSDVMNPWRGLEYFTRELMPDDLEEFRGNTQDAVFFFEAIGGVHGFGDVSIPFFSFMRPTTQLIPPTRNDCERCQRQQGKSQCVT